jgi:hypothetical protein
LKKVINGQPGVIYSMPKARLSNAEILRRDKYKKSSKRKSKSIWSEKQIRQRIKDKVVRERFKALGYAKGGTGGHYPCLCGDYPEDNPVWWMGGTDNKPDHLYCLRCRKRVYEDEIADAIKAWHEMKKPRDSLRKALTK